MKHLYLLSGMPRHSEAVRQDAIPDPHPEPDEKMRHPRLRAIWNVTERPFTRDAAGDPVTEPAPALPEVVPAKVVPAAEAP